MRPRLAINDAVYVGHADAKLFSKLALEYSTGSVPSTNLKDLLLSKPCHRMPLALAISVIALVVFSVLLWRSPCQIVEPIVGRITVQMSCFHTFRTWAYECLQYQTVNSERNWLTFPSEIEMEVRSAFGSFAMRRRLHLSPFIREKASPTATSPCAPDRAVTAGTVAWKSWDVTILNRIVFRHDRLLPGDDVQDQQAFRAPA